MKLSEINIRDPFILTDGGKYYMYGTRVRVTEEFPYGWGDQRGFDVYVSHDMENWSEPKCVFEVNDNFWGKSEFWAPEVHIYRGKYYMLASFIAEGAHRGTHILVSDTPDGRFVPVSEEPATPREWECLDGTFYVDKKGKPHIIFCHEWVQIGIGTVCEAELSEDLTRRVSEPRVLWSAKDHPDIVSISDEREAFVTDGPFLYRCDNGDLISIWSSFSENGYIELLSKSDNGDIDGSWTVLPRLLFGNDGGHGMIFKDLDGRLLFTMHSPNATTLERPVIYPVCDGDGTLTIE
ncbi:MAG: family 43 glycosylhydrolase [Clostridia bacterium]|nr:family 43 glycosylhydrolase [Clostridia bacterium]